LAAKIPILRMKSRQHWFLIVAALCLAACGKPAADKGGPADSLQVDALASHIDSTEEAGEDFFAFANGKWFKENPIKPSERSAGLWRMIQDTLNA
jgi:putative endopeptidase